MTSREILKKIALILEDHESSDEEKVKAIALWAKPSKSSTEIPRTRLIFEELAQYNLTKSAMKKLQERIFPFLDSLPKLKATAYNPYYYHYLPFWIMFKDKGYADAETARYISNLAKKRWPNSKLPNPKGTVRRFTSLAKKFELAQN